MAAIMSPEAVVADQQKYAIEKDIPGIFEALTMTLVVNKPEEPLTFISSEASRLAAANSLELPEVRCCKPMLATRAHPFLSA